MLKTLQDQCVYSIWKELAQNGLRNRLKLEYLNLLPSDLIHRVIFSKKWSTNDSDSLKCEVLVLFENLEVETINLNEFDININCLDTFVSVVLTKAVSRMNRFHISYNNTFTDYSIATLTSHYPNLIELSLNNCTQMTFESLVNLNSFHQLERLAIIGCRIKIEYWPIQSNRLVSLHIGGNEFDESILYSIAEQCPFINELSLSCSSYFDFTSPTYDSLTISLFKFLQRLDLRHVMLKDDYVYEAFSTLSSLTTVDATESNLGHELIQGLATYPIQSLSMMSTSIRFTALELLASVSWTSTLIHLSIAKTNLLPRSGEYQLWTFSHFKVLEHLDLHDSTIFISPLHGQYYQRKEGIQLFPCSLRFLDISQCHYLLNNNHISSSIILADSIKPLMNLTALHMSSMYIAENHWITILTDKPKMRSLELAETNITDHVFKFTIVLMKRLRYLGLVNCRSIQSALIECKAKVFPRLKECDNSIYEMNSDDYYTFMSWITGRDISSPSYMSPNHIDSDGTSIDEIQTVLDSRIEPIFVDYHNMIELRNRSTTRYLPTRFKIISGYARDPDSIYRGNNHIYGSFVVLK